MQIDREAMPEFWTGSGTVGTTATRLSEATLPIRKCLFLRATKENSGTLSIGTTQGSASAGFVLGAGETSPPIYIDDLAKVWIVASAAGQSFSWIAF